MSSSRNTPLTARSVLASVLLGTDPPWLPTPLLIRTAALFGITEGSTRTALSRMAGTGEVLGEDGGYRLAGHLVDRQRRQASSRRARVRPWDGTWELATVEGDTRRSAADRATLREALLAARLVELREGVWGRPDNLDHGPSSRAPAVIGLWCVRWRGARPAPEPEPSTLWDLRGWTTGANALREEMARLAAPLEAGDVSVLPDGFVTSAAVLRLLQADPLLPEELLEPHWPGTALRAEYDDYDAAYRAVLRHWFRR